MKFGLLALAALTSCSKPAPYPDPQVGPLVIEMEQRKAEIRQLREDLEFEKKYLRATSAVLDDVRDSQASLTKTLNHNAQAFNENATGDMTRRGACGTEWTQDINGQWFQTNKKCTVSDLKK